MWVPLIVGMFAGYVVGNLMEGERFSSIATRITQSAIGWGILIGGLLLLVATAGGVVTFAGHLYQNMPFWAFVIAVLLFLILVLLAMIVVALTRKRKQ